jgi:hypothetical protein
MHQLALFDGWDATCDRGGQPDPPTTHARPSVASVAGRLWGAHSRRRPASPDLRTRRVTAPDRYYCCMADELVWRRLHDLAADQFGLFTAAQARHHGVARYQLSRGTESGELFRAHHGVYGFTADSATRFLYEDWAAQWLALRPAADIDDRRAAPDCIISHDSAAVIRDLGTIVSHGLFLTGPTRINPRGARIHTYRRGIGARGEDWDLVEGLPVATAGRIITDLARDELDGAHLGTVIADVLDAGLLALAEVGERLTPFVHRWDEPDGAALAHRFLDAAGRPTHR